MSAPDSNPATTRPDVSTLVAQMAGILAVAAVLGVIYNNATPLAVKPPSEDMVAMPTNSVAHARPTATTAYANQTLAMNVETTAPSLPPQAPIPQQPSPSVAPMNPSAAAPLKIPELKWAEVKSLLAQNKIVLLDARLKPNYDIAHIPGAISLPATSSATELQAFASQFSKNTYIVTYCGSDSCHMSRSLAENLVKICGFTNVSEMPGGFAEYQIAEAASANKPTQ